MTPHEPVSAREGDDQRASLAVIVLALLVVLKLLMHTLALTSYGYFRDELYYLASTSHLDWGYVDNPPLSIGVLALVRAMLGDSLPAIRIVPALAGAAIVVVTAAIT